MDKIKLEDNNFVAIGLIANIIFIITIFLGLNYVIKIKSIDSYSTTVLILNIIGKILIAVYGYGMGSYIITISGILFTFYYSILLIMKLFFKRELTLEENIKLLYDRYIRRYIAR